MAGQMRNARSAVEIARKIVLDIGAMLRYRMRRRTP
jgi:hypothetical protein